MAIENNEPTTQYLLFEAIRRQIELEGKKLMEKAIKEVREEMVRRTPEIVAGVTVHVMKMVDFQSMSDRIVFTIRKQEK